MHDGAKVRYDVLMLATGSTNNYFGHLALARHTIGMKQLGEAIRLRNHVLSCLEMAARAADPGERRSWLSFVVAGGGPTGVEYAGRALAAGHRERLPGAVPRGVTDRAGGGDG